MRVEQHINRIETYNLSKSGKLMIRMLIGIAPAFIGSMLAFIPTPLAVIVSMALLYLSARPVQPTLFTFDPDEKFWKISTPINFLFVGWGVLLVLVGHEVELYRSLGAMVVLATTAIWPVYVGQVAYSRRKRKISFEKAYALIAGIVMVQQLLIIGGGQGA